MTDPRLVSVPEDLALAIEEISTIMREELTSLNPEIGESDLVVTKPQIRGAFLETLAGVGLFLGAIVVQSLTKKWIEEVLWPRIEPILEDQTDEVIARIKAFLLSLTDREE